MGINVDEESLDPQADAIWILSSTFIVFTMQSGLYEAPQLFPPFDTPRVFCVVRTYQEQRATHTKKAMYTIFFQVIYFQTEV